jgi:hypothetical protein
MASIWDYKKKKEKAEAGEIEIKEPGTDLMRLVETSELDQEKQDFILKTFKDYEFTASLIKLEADKIVVTEYTQTDLMKQAKEKRLVLKDKRITIEKTRKRLKAQSLLEGKAIDSIAKYLTGLIEPIEEYLEKQEKFIELAEAEKERLRREEAMKLLEAEEERKRIELEETQRKRDERTKAIYKLGFKWDGVGFIRGNRLIAESALDLSDDDFTKTVADTYKDYLQDVEKKKAEDAKIQKFWGLGIAMVPGKEGKFFTEGFAVTVQEILSTPDIDALYNVCLAKVEAIRQKKIAEEAERLATIKAEEEKQRKEKEQKQQELNKKAILRPSLSVLNEYKIEDSISLADTSRKATFTPDVVIQNTKTPEIEEALKNEVLEPPKINREVSCPRCRNVFRVSSDNTELTELKDALKDIAKTCESYVGNDPMQNVARRLRKLIG